MDFRIEYGHAKLAVTCEGSSKQVALFALIDCYDQIVSHINEDPVFGIAYEPVDVPEYAPQAVAMMAKAAKLANVGPMAAVAGTIAQLVGNALIADNATHVVVENGGDIFIFADHMIRVGIWAGEGNPNNKLAFRVEPEYTPICACTSSSSVGHSVSLGKADSVTVFARSGAIADAFATSIANRVSSPRDMQDPLGFLPPDCGVRGVYISAFGGFAGGGPLPEIEKV